MSFAPNLLSLRHRVLFHKTILCEKKRFWQFGVKVCALPHPQPRNTDMDVRRCNNIMRGSLLDDNSKGKFEIEIDLALFKIDFHNLVGTQKS